MKFTKNSSFRRPFRDEEFSCSKCKIYLTNLVQCAMIPNEWVSYRQEEKLVLDALRNGEKAVGVKQSKKAVQSGQAVRVFIAEDADPFVTDPIVALCESCGVPVSYAPEMAALGNACSIKVGAAVAALLK